jgi:hypothetical protein
MVKVRVIKLLGLAGVTALVALAFVGAGTASADSACLVDPPEGAQGTCPKESIWNGPIIGLSQEAVWGWPDQADTKCKSEFLADWIKNEGEKVGLLYLILTFTFTDCLGGPCNKKEIKSENTPWELLVLMAAQVPGGEKEHSFLREDGKGRPAFLQNNCIFDSMELNCLYEFAKEVLINYFLEEKEGKPLVGALNVNVGLNRGLGDSQMCPKLATLTAAYLIYEDVNKVEGSELFFTAIP